MLNAVRTFLRYLALVYLAMLAASFIANNLIAPLIGAQAESTAAIAVSRVLMHLLVIVLDADLRRRNGNLRRAYIGTLGDRPYDRAADLRTVLRTPATWIEAALYAAIMLGVSALGRPTWLRVFFLGGIPLFAAANAAATVWAHGRWAAERMRK